MGMWGWNGGSGGSWSGGSGGNSGSGSSSGSSGSSGTGSGENGRTGAVVVNNFNDGCGRMNALDRKLLTLARAVRGLFGKAKSIGQFWVRADDEERKLRPATVEEARMVLLEGGDLGLLQRQIDELGSAGLRGALNLGLGLERGRAALAKEAEARIAADEAEAAARAAADAAEETARINAVAAEQQARMTADNAESSARQTADNAEASARQVAVSGLQQQINNETSARAQADNNLQQAIDNVVNSVGIADSQMGSPGYMQFGNGLLLQWGFGQHFMSLRANETHSFSITFPKEYTTLYAISFTPWNALINSFVAFPSLVWLAYGNKDHIDVSIKASEEMAAEYFRFSWFAIGRIAATE